jgi:hypothetical protein
VSWIAMAEARRRSSPRLNETVESLRMVMPSAGTPEMLAIGILAGSRKLGHGAAERMARAVWYRYCAPEPLAYSQIAAALGGITPQHARRLVTRGLGYLQAVRERPRRGSRLDRALREGRVL